ncbi:hypothetical protein MTO96_036536 [Rhipicephalus appendiculatus]
MSDTAGNDEACTDLWESQLDMDRACGAVSSEETCWLCDDLTAWNRVTSALGLELEESRPGMLLLRCSFRMEGSSEQVTGVRPVTAVRPSIVSRLMALATPPVHPVCDRELPH